MDETITETIFVKDNLENTYPEIPKELMDKISLDRVIYSTRLPKLFTEAFQVEDTKKLERLIPMYHRGMSKDILGATINLYGSAEFVGKPTKLSIKEKIIRLTYNNGYTIIMDKSQTNQKLFDSVEDEFMLVEKLSTYQFIKCKPGMLDNKNVYYGEIKPTAIRVDRVNAQELLNLLPAWKCFFYAMSLKSTYDSVRLILPRIMAWFVPNLGLENNRLIIAQFTPPEVGKSFYGFLTKYLFKAEYVNGVPSVAYAIGDCTTGDTGIMGLNDIVIFDEFDKWQKDRYKELGSPLLTGMWQSEWARPSATKAGGKIGYNNSVAIVFFGNTDVMKMDSGLSPREIFRDYLKNLGEGSPLAFENRITIVDIIRKCEPLEVAVLKDKTVQHPVIRGLVAILQDKLEYTKPLETKFYRSQRRNAGFNKIFCVLKVLFSDLTDEQLSIISKEFIIYGYSPELMKILKLERPKEEVPPKVFNEDNVIMDGEDLEVEQVSEEEEETEESIKQLEEEIKRKDKEELQKSPWINDNVVTKKEN